jgi:hypothetical protein
MMKSMVHIQLGRKSSLGKPCWSPHAACGDKELGPDTGEHLAGVGGVGNLVLAVGQPSVWPQGAQSLPLSQTWSRVQISPPYPHLAPQRDCRMSGTGLDPHKGAVRLHCRFLTKANRIKKAWANGSH